MKTLNLYIILFLIFLASACAKKKYPDSVVENASVYKFHARVGNTDISLNAGQDGYYMYSSYHQDTNRVYNFTADLRQEDCSDCRNSLKVQINDFKVSLPDEPAVIDSSLFPKTYVLLSGINNYDVQFQSQFNKQAASYIWDFGDGVSSNDANPLHTYTQPGNYKVKLTVKSTNSCQSSIYNVQQINASTTNLKAGAVYSNAGANVINFTPVVSGGKPPYSYLWNFGDGKTSTTPVPLHTYQVIGSYPVSLRVTDAANNVSIVNYNIVTQNDQSSCVANYKMSAITQTITSVLEKTLSKIIISWTDADGLVYTSNSDLQPLTSRFEILSVEDAGLNENNEPTKKLRLKFNCKVYNGTKSLSIDDAETTICVAYK